MNGAPALRVINPGQYVEGILASRGFASLQIGGDVPEVTYVSPAPASTIGENDPIVLDVTDTDTANPSTFLFVQYVNGAVEVVWDGGAFTPFYAGSTRVLITDGARYTLRRTNGWIAGSITFKANAIDDTGGIAT